MITNSLIFRVLEAGLEPAQPQWPRDFKSRVSTDSTTRASSCERAKNGTRTRDPDLGKVVLYQLSHYRVCFVFPSEQYILYYRSSYLSTTFFKFIFSDFFINYSNFQNIYVPWTRQNVTIAFSFRQVLFLYFYFLFYKKSQRKSSIRR